MSLTIAHLERDLQWVAENRGVFGVPDHAYVEVGRYKPYHGSIVKAAERRGYRVERLGDSSYAVYPKLDAAPAESQAADEGQEFEITLSESDGTATVDVFNAPNADAAEWMCRGRYPGCQIAETVPA